MDEFYQPEPRHRHRRERKEREVKVNLPYFYRKYDIDIYLDWEMKVEQFF